MAFIRGSSGVDDFVYKPGGDAPAVPDGASDIPDATIDADRVLTFGGADTIYGDGGDDTIVAGTGDDALFGEAGDDSLNGDEGADLLVGGGGDDFLWGFKASPISADGPDTLRGGAGNDTLWGDNFGDRMTGGPGADTFIVEPRTRITTGTEAFEMRDVITDFNPAEGDQLDLTLLGISDRRMFSEITTTKGDGIHIVHYVGGLPQELVLKGYYDADAVWDSAIYDLETQGQLVRWNSLSSEGFRPIATTTSHVFGGVGDDTLDGAETTAKALQFSDYLLAGEGDDLVRANGGDDFLMGGPGADTLDGGTGIDRASYVHAGGGVVVNLGAGTGARSDAAGDALIAIEEVVGSGHNDRLIGSGAANMLFGEAGADRIEGRGGADELFGGRGNDLIKGGAGRDTLSAEAGSDTLKGGKGADFLFDGAFGEDLLDGGAGRDTLYASFAGDTTMTGGAGVDRFLFVHGGTATVTDFNLAKEVLAFDPIVADRPKSVAAFKRDADQVGADVVFDGGGDGFGVIVLRDVDLDDLQARNFDFG